MQEFYRPSSDNLKLISEIKLGESLNQAEGLFKRWEVKSKQAAELVKFFKTNTQPETWEVFENKPFQTFRISGFALRKINGNNPLFSLKEWHPQDPRIPTENCFLTFSIYRKKEFFNIWNIPDFRLQLDHNSEEIISCNQAMIIDRSRISPQLFDYLQEIENYFENFNRSNFSSDKLR